MNFISGVVFIKEVVVISLMGWGLLNVIAIALCAMMVGGVRLHINGSRNFCDGERIVGSVSYHSHFRQLWTDGSHRKI